MIPPLKKTERRVIARLLAAWVFLMAFGVPHYAYAYIDPATTTYIIQIAAALVITLGVSFSIVLYRFRMVITQLWVRLIHPSRKTAEQERAGQSPESSAEGLSQLAARSARMHEFVLEGSPVPPEKAHGFVKGDVWYTEALDQAFSKREAQEAGAGHKKAGSQADNKKAATSKPGSLKERLSFVWDDQRSFKLRLALAALASAGIVFTVLVFGPLELFATSPNDMLFTLGDFAPALLLVAFIVFAVLTAVLMLLKGKLFDNALCVVIGLLLACYIQATFFNGFLGQLTGDTIQWQDYRLDALLNLLLWVGLVVLFFVVRLLSKKIWQAVVVFIPSALIVMQLVALVSLSGSLFAAPDPGEQDLVLTKEGTLELSNQQNVVVFLLDKFDQTYISDLESKDPHFFERLEGFTHYTDYLTRYSYTYPSIAHSLTGLKNDYEKPSSEYLPEAYGQHLFVDDLVESGWTSRLYLSGGYDYSSKQLLEGRVENLVDTSEEGNGYNPADDFSVSLKLVEQLNQLSALRYAPTGLKSLFWMSSTDVSEVIVDARNEYTSGYQAEFMDDLMTTGLSAESEDPVFMYYHLDGSHRPHYLGSDGYEVPSGESDPLVQTEGCFKIIFEYLDQLKELGIYDDTTVIILGDHGVKGETLAGLFYKPADATTEPLTRSAVPVSDSNLVPTIVEQAGITSTADAAQDLTFTEVTEENTPVRKVVQHYRNKQKDYVLSIYEIRGEAANKDNWELLSQEESGLNYWMEQRT